MKSLFEMSKQELYDEALLLVQQFADRNTLPLPQFLMKAPPVVGNGPYARARLTGLQWEDKIYVNLDACARPALGKHRAWSFPGHKIDRTPYGVLCHEFGHWVDLCLNIRWTKDIRRLFYRTCKVSGYEPIAKEAFAETMRLFITNSDLLKHGSEERYKFVTEFLGLVPVIKEPFEWVLRNNQAPQTIVKSALRWARMGRSVLRYHDI